MTGSTIRQLLLIGAAVSALSACSSSTSAVDSQTTQNSSQQSDAASTTVTAATDATVEEAAGAGTEDTIEAAKIIKRESKVPKRGVYIKILVNRNPITNTDINRRSAFLKLRRAPGNRTKVAEREMIEQVLKLQEAKRGGVLATDEMVNRAFAGFAKRNRATQAQLSRELNRRGIGVDHFKEFIRTQISWQRVVSGRFQAETINLSERDAVTQLRKSGNEKPEVTEYNFKQVVFVVPKNQRSKATLSKRRQEANTFRQRFTGCDDALTLAKTVRDVSVIDRKRIMGPELPERWKDEIGQTDANGTTRAKETDKGIEFIAVCSTRQVNDDRAAKVATQSAEFESFNAKGSELDEKYLSQLKSRATIIYQ